MPTRMQLLFQMTTDPTNKTAASAHTGGWSEGFWFANPPSNPAATAGILAQARIGCAASEVSIVGWRQEIFSFSGNRLLPGGAVSGLLTVPGPPFALDAPWLGLSINGIAAGAPNNNRFVLRGLPGVVIANGEFQPGLGFASLLGIYLGQLLANNTGFIGRNKSGANARVVSVTGNVVVLSQAIGGVAGTDFLRLNRVYADNGLPIKGSYLISNIAGGTNYTVNGLIPPGNASKPSGTARIDSVSFFAYSSFVNGRLVAKKIGRPFQGYRGRRSHLRA